MSMSGYLLGHLRYDVCVWGRGGDAEKQTKKGIGRYPTPAELLKERFEWHIGLTISFLYGNL